MAVLDPPGLRVSAPWTVARAAAAALVIGLAACGGGSGGGGNNPPGVDAAIDAPPPPPWWQPQVGQARNWDIQLSAAAGAVDVSTPRLMYDLDLWALVPSPTTIDYGDGKPVTVPAGALAGTIAQLHATTPPTLVICHVDVAMLDLTLPDAAKFPGYMADPTKIPDNPDMTAPGTVKGQPAAGSAIGWTFGNGAAQRLLDVRAASRSAWDTILFKRFDLARQIGCDGVDPSHANTAEYISGFPAGSADSFSWYTEVADQGHLRKLSTGMKDGDTLGGQTDVEADHFDWLMTERCGELGGCDSARPFINLGKAVFAIDYDHDQDGNAQGSTLVCMQQGLAMIADGLYKDVALSKAVRTQCEP